MNNPLKNTPNLTAQCVKNLINNAMIKIVIKCGLEPHPSVLVLGGCATSYTTLTMAFGLCNLPYAWLRLWVYGSHR